MSVTDSAKSAATGRPHYFGRLYTDGPACIFCGQAREHPWHLEEPQRAS